MASALTGVLAACSSSTDATPSAGADVLGGRGGGIAASGGNVGATGESAASGGGQSGASAGGASATLGAGGWPGAGVGPIGGGSAFGGASGAGQGDGGSTSPSSDGGGSPSGGGAGDGSCAPPEPSPLLGWASVSGSGTDRTTGGEGGTTTTVSSLAELVTALSGSTARTVLLRGAVTGSVPVGSNKTLVGACGATIHGHLAIDGSVNVVVRNLAMVGYGCTDSPSDCSAGADAITVQGGAHHLWFDHLDVSDGSDGNLDLTHAADFVTVSWTKFHYSGRRTDPAGAAGGHQFSNLIGHSDGNGKEDAGHLRITFHHTWWADNSVERMPRVRFGQVHLFNDLYTSSGNDYCIGVGNGSSILSESNVFIGVKDPIKSYSTDGTGVIHSAGNVYQSTSGSSADVGTGTVFTPPYSVALDPTTTLESAIRAGAGPR